MIDPTLIENCLPHLPLRHFQMRRLARNMGVARFAVEAGNAVRPAYIHQIGKCVVGIREVLNGFKECFWRLHEVSMERKAWRVK